MPKTRLTIYKKDVIFGYMCLKLNNCNEAKKVDKAFKKCIAEVNKFISKEYPEKDMEVLKKYNLIMIDHCMKFSIPDGFNNVFAFNVPHELQKDCGIKEVAYRSTCRKVYTGTKHLKDIIEAYENAIGELQNHKNKKKSEYRSFLNLCKYVEDVEEAVALPLDIRTDVYGENTALVAMNPEKLESIKSEFNTVIN